AGRVAPGIGCAPPRGRLDERAEPHAVDLALSPRQPLDAIERRPGPGVLQRIGRHHAGHEPACLAISGADRETLPWTKPHPARQVPAERHLVRVLPRPAALDLPVRSQAREPGAPEATLERDLAAEPGADHERRLAGRSGGSRMLGAHPQGELGGRLEDVVLPEAALE